MDSSIAARDATDVAAQPHVIGISVVDTADNVMANLDALQKLAAGGTLDSVTLSDTGLPTLAVSAGEWDAMRHYWLAQDLFNNPSDAVSDAALHVLRTLSISGGDPFEIFALLHSSATTSQGLLDDLDAAKVYSAYIQNPLDVPLGIALSATSAQYQAWASDLAQAQALGLDRLTYAGDALTVQTSAATLANKISAP